MQTTENMSKQKKLKHVKIYNELYELIQNGTYKPGSQLPPETTLSTTMNVSRMTLRKALTLLREDGMIKDVPGVGHFVRTSKPDSMNVRKDTNEVLLSDHTNFSSSANKRLAHPIYSYCQEDLDTVELEFRIEPPTKSILDSLGQYTAAVVIVDRWYKHEGHTIAYSLSFIPIELIGKLQIDLNTTDALQNFLESTCYERGHKCNRSITYSTAGNFSAKNYKLSNHNSFLLTLENIYNIENEILVVSKHYIPSELFELKLNLNHL